MPRTVEEIYQKKTPKEHILLRPDTYIGSIERDKQEQFVFDSSSGRIVRRAVSYVPGLYKIFDEILVNAADNKIRDSKMKILAVEIDASKGTISVFNDGQGIPIEIHAKEKVYVPELIFGHLLTSSNYDDAERKMTGGRNGYGAKLCNIFSSHFVVETADGRRRYEQHFRSNMDVTEQAVIEPLPSAQAKTTSSSKRTRRARQQTEDDKEKDTIDTSSATGCAPDSQGAGAGNSDREKMTPFGCRTYTRITFEPDYRRFNMDGLDEDTLALLTRRVYDMCATLSDVAVWLNGTRLPLGSFEDYVRLYLPSGDEPVVCQRLGPRWEVALASAPRDEFHQVSFVNSIATSKGGTHVTHVLDRLIEPLAEGVKKVRPEYRSLEVKPAHVRSSLFLFVNCLVENPAFDSQTKEHLTLRQSSFGSAVPAAAAEALAREALKTTQLADRIASHARARQSAQLKKTDGAKTSRLVGIPKLEDANFAGTRRSSECTLILTEGDSAKTLAVAGLGIVGRDKYGVFPLRGKLLNVREASHAQIAANAEICSLKKILGLQHGREYADATPLRYGHVMLMTDQDHDGSHIKGLLINFFDHFFGSLLRVPGFLLEFVTPIVRVTLRRKKSDGAIQGGDPGGAAVSEVETLIERDGAAGRGGGARQRSSARGAESQRLPRTIDFFTLPEYETWRNDSEEASQYYWTAKYYKGLGTSTPADARVYFSALERHVKSFVPASSEDTALIELAFARKKADARKDWLAAVEPGTFLDHSAAAIRISDFINRELVLFSAADNIRSIPSLVDGLKPGQRKVLFCCFKRNLRAEIKVAQLVGYVSEHSAYHHGEASLCSTIINMAHDFVGSNNINLLLPIGSFGSRLQGGKDAASARYIFTSLNHLTRLLFVEGDDPLLEYLEDDSQPIEPLYYVPILPLVLINGAEGIGTGWSTSIPNYSPRDVLRNVRAFIYRRPFEPMTPWYRGFRGSISGVERSGARKRKYGEENEVASTTVSETASVSCPAADSLTSTTEGSSTSAAAVNSSSFSRSYSHFVVSGTHSVEADSTIRITELPVGTWTQTYKEYLESLVQDGTVREYSEYHTERSVDFRVSCVKQFNLKLSTTVSTTNMICFDAAGRLRRYSSPLEIIADFCAVRLRFYEKRKAHRPSVLRADLVRLENKARFVEEVVGGSLVIARRPMGEVEAELESKNYARISVSAGSEEGKTTGGVPQSGRGKRSGYEYLLGMRISSLTAEQIAILRKELSDIRREYDELQTTAPEALWRADLDRFEEAYNRVEAAEEADRAKEITQRPRNEGDQKKRRGSRTAPKTLELKTAALEKAKSRNRSSEKEKAGASGRTSKASQKKDVPPAKKIKKSRNDEFVTESEESNRSSAMVSADSSDGPWTKYTKRVRK